LHVIMKMHLMLMLMIGDANAMLNT
jgi:hypothetical protein